MKDCYYLRCRIFQCNLIMYGKSSRWLQTHRKQLKTAFLSTSTDNHFPRSRTIHSFHALAKRESCLKRMFVKLWHLTHFLGTDKHWQTARKQPVQHWPVSNQDLHGLISRGSYWMAISRSQFQTYCHWVSFHQDVGTRHLSDVRCRLVKQNASTVTRPDSSISAD